MKRITCVVAAILLLIFVVRGVIFPIVNHAGGGSSKDAETVNVQANTAGTSMDNSTEDASASSDSGSSDSSGDSSSDNSSTDATVMPVKGTAAADKLSVMTPGWHEDSTGKWYQNPDGTYYINGFAEIDGTTYSFDENGYMQTGWVEKGVKDYYFNEDGSYDPTQKRPMIALTFDDGPGEYTETLLDTVEKYNIHVTFFMLGQNVEGRESTIQRMVQLGCEIGNHTWDHPSQTLPNMDLDSVVQEFQKTDDELVKACGQAATVCRAPYGAITEEQMAAVGKPFFMWSTDSLDWKLMDADADYNEIIRSVGGIDMQLLGIGGNGHIGFNEPGAAFEKETHCVDLTESTIKANARFFESMDEVPKQAYTMGIKSIMAAKKILLVATGSAKADALYKSLYGPITPNVPASIIQLHQDVTVVADEDALSLIKEKGLL